MKPSIRKLKYPQLIVLVFALVIFVGAALLMLPAASRSGTPVPFIDAIFTATSANCITGLVVYDTYSQWTLFGQIVILVLIQAGGLGYMALATLFSLAVGRKIGVGERLLMKEAIGSPHLHGVVSVTKTLLLGTFFFEGLGAIILAFRFCPRMGLGEGIYNAVFHSISSFCSAGFDLMGKYRPFSSLTTFSDDPVVCLTTAGLIAMGGIGYLVWADVWAHGLRYKKYTLHTKIVLTTTGVLIVGAALLYYVIEADRSMTAMGVGETISNALFQSITPRTGGLNTLDVSKMSDSTVMLTILLMIIGGSPGSTAGGIKTTVFFIMMASVWATLRGRRDIEVFKRRIDDSLIKKASTLTVLYLTIALLAIALISLFQDLPLRDVIFEVFSAIGTVGLSMGATPLLSTASKITVILLMYFGRIGVFSIMLTFFLPKKDVPVRYPAEGVNLI